MAYDAGTFDATLAAAADGDAALMAELRQVYIESVERQIDLLFRARCDGNWQIAALRLKGLAASFYAEDLHELAEEALYSAPGEPGVIRRLRAYATEISPD